MGLFDLFKKKGEDKNESKPQEQMLTLKERQKPALKSSTKPPTTPPQVAKSESIMLTPDPTVNKAQETAPDFVEPSTPEPEAQEYLKENLSTKSLEKGIKSMPNVKKLVIPSNNEALSQKVEATDTVTAERVMKQVDLPGTEKPKEDIAPSTPNYVPGEFIDLPISFFTDSIEQKYLSTNSQTLFDNSSTIRFTKDEVLSIMAQGAFAVVGSALLARFPQDMVSEQGKTTTEVFEFALDSIMALVPPDWFALQGQDDSLVSSLNNMSNPFQDLEEPEEVEKIVEETQVEPKSNSLFSDDDEEEEFSVETEEEEIDPLATIEQVAPPIIEEEVDPLATIEQVAPPLIQKTKAVTDDNTLAVETSTISAALSPEIFTTFASDAALAIPRERVLQSLAEGVFTLTASEVDQYAGTSNAKPGKLNETVAIELSLIMGLIPPEWFSLQGQDNSQNELLSNMSDVFDDSTFEEAVKEFEQNESLGETVIDVDREVHQEVTVEEEEDNDDEAQEVSIEEEEDEEESLITGGIFGKMNGLFEEEDEEQEISIEEEDEQTAVQNFLEDEDEEEAVTLVIEDETEPLADTQPEPEALVQESETEKSSDSLEDLETIEKAQNNPVSDSVPTLVQLTPPPKVEKIVDAKKPEEKPVQAKAIDKGFDLETKNVPDAGKVTYRAVNDNVPDVSDAAILRPSTAPNGIDINRSNLADLCRLHSAGEKLAQTLIEYREQNGDFKSVNELINVPGVGSSVYKSLTGLRPSADLVAAERRINKSVGLETDKDYSLGRIIKEAQKKFGFKSIILSDKDGFEICFSGDKSLLESNSELLAATTPQLFKKTKHFLKQSLLPHPEVFTFYLEDTPVTFGIADEVYMVMVHSSKWPEPKHMKKCRTLINELAWFCSYRAIV